jgi:hypothetical protein
MLTSQYYYGIVINKHPLLIEGMVFATNLNLKKN